MEWRASRDYSVGELGADIDAFLGEAFREVWVVGSVERLRLHSNGHRYFELVEKGAGDRIVGRLDAVIWSRDRWRIEADLRRSHVDLADGIEARCLVQVGFWAPGGRLQASVRAIDPLFSLGVLERRRRAVREQLIALGIAAANRELKLPDLPLRVGVVASGASAAFQDVLASLRASGRPFQLAFVNARVQGAAAEGELVRAFEALGQRADLDCVVIVRGGGARGDLAAFDSLAVARAVASCRYPVLTGLGHETDSTICDEVAWRACHTPTRVAEVLVAAVEAAAERVAHRGRRVVRASERGIERGRAALSRAQGRMAPAARRLDRAAASLERKREQVARAGGIRLETSREKLRFACHELDRRSRVRLERSAEGAQHRRVALLAAVARRLDATGRRLEGLARLTRELGPRRWLERGFCIARDAQGRVIRDARVLAPGAELFSELAHGRLVSRVEEVHE